MNDQRFEFLLKKYLNRSISREEEQELKDLVLTDNYQNHFREELASYMKAHFEASRELQVPIDEDQLYEKIVNRCKNDVDNEKPVVSVWYLTRIAAMLLLSIGAGWWLFFASPKIRTSFLTEEATAEDTVVRFTRKDFIKLPDGSTVLLNEDSELSYRLPFGNGHRDVTLIGEAFFDIVHDQGRPFVVHTGNISTNVLGTAFNVNARNKNVIVTVERGLVRVSDETQTLSLVRPDEKLTVNTVTSDFRKTEVKAAEENLWKSQSIVFDDIPLRQATDILQTRFGDLIEIENPGIKNCRINAWFLGSENLDEILEMVCGIRQAHYHRRDDKIVITGGIACEP